MKNQSVCAPLVFILTTACSLFATESTQRWAIISTDASCSGLADLLTVELTNWDRVSLVERNRIKSILDELKLAASGLTDGRHTIQFGKLAKADALLLISHSDEGAIRIRLVETASSVRLLDLAVSGRNLQQESSVILSELEKAYEKASLPSERRRLYRNRTYQKL